MSKNNSFKNLFFIAMATVVALGCSPLNSPFNSNESGTNNPAGQPSGPNPGAFWPTQVHNTKVWKTNGEVSSAYLLGNILFVGGNFSALMSEDGRESVLRTNLAAIDLTTGKPTPWDPNVNGKVLAIKADQSRLYIGGEFTEVSGRVRRKLASIELSDLSLTNWIAMTDSIYGYVSNLEIVNNTVYVSGVFSSINGTARESLAAVDKLTGTVLSWSPNIGNKLVSSLKVIDNFIYIAGSFQTVDGIFVGRAARFATNSGVLDTTWTPFASNSINSLAGYGNTIFAAGIFTSLGGQFRSGIGGVTTTTALAVPLDMAVDNDVRDLASADGYLYAGGFFSTIGNRSQSHLARIRISDNSVESWAPKVDGSIYQILAGKSYVIAVGEGRSIYVYGLGPQ